MNKIILFEQLNLYNKPIVYLYLRNGFKVLYLRISNNAISDSRLKVSINDGAIEHFKIDKTLSYFDSIYCDKAFKNIDKFYLLYNNEPLVQKMRDLYSSDKTDLIFKRKLVERLSRFYYLNYVMSKFRESFYDSKIFFVPSKGVENFFTDGCEAYDYKKLYTAGMMCGADICNTDAVIFPFWVKVGTSFMAFTREISVRTKIWLKVSHVLLNKVYAISYNKLLPRSGVFKQAIMIISPARQFANNIQTVDFLIDNDMIRREETIFLSYHRLNKEHVHRLQEKKCVFVDNLDRLISLKDLLYTLPAYVLLTFSLSEWFLIDSTAELIRYHLRWRSFAKKFSISKLVTYCDAGIQSIARNIILQVHKCQTYYYMDSINYGYFMRKIRSDSLFTHCYTGFLIYDYLFYWNKEVIMYYQNCKAQIGKYIDLGCLWAGHAREVREGIVKSDFIKDLNDHGYRNTMKIVSVFDSTFHDDSIATYDDGIEFLSSIVKLLNKYSDIFIVIKEKKLKSFHAKKTTRFEEIAILYDSLSSHPRCMCMGSRSNPSEMIAFSDLTISFPFTSPTFEALSLRSKAIWYDATNKFRGVFYDSIPDIVCHSFEDLCNKVELLLWKMNDTEYNSYLDLHVKGKLESYLDGRAITRLREYLARGGQNKALLYPHAP